MSQLQIVINEWQTGPIAPRTTGLASCYQGKHRFWMSDRTRSGFLRSYHRRVKFAAKSFCGKISFVQQITCVCSVCDVQRSLTSINVQLKSAGDSTCTRNRLCCWRDRLLFSYSEETEVTLVESRRSDWVCLLWCFTSPLLIISTVSNMSHTDLFKLSVGRVPTAAPTRRRHDDGEAHPLMWNHLYPQYQTFSVRWRRLHARTFSSARSI